MSEFLLVKQKLAYLHENEDFSKADLPVSVENENTHLLWTAGHRYEVSPCLDETQIREVEAMYNLSLPEDYRRFLLEVGNGGAGPVWGLYTLDEAVEESGAAGLDGFFNAPFPYVSAWEETDADCMSDDIYHVQGSLAVGDFGCGIQFRLVLVGPERGNIWLDDRANCKGVAPLTVQDGKVFWPGDLPETGVHVSFVTWYTAWLDEEIARLHQRLHLVS